jgi:hypothetical protein
VTLTIAVLHIGVDDCGDGRSWASKHEPTSSARHNAGAVVLGKLGSIGQLVAVLLSCSDLMEYLEKPPLSLDISRRRHCIDVFASADETRNVDEWWIAAGILGTIELG